jgi:hypothetical protein
MNPLRDGWHRLASGRRVSAVGAIASMLVVAGLLLGTTTHMGFMLLVAAGAFGPGTLRQLGLLNDLDEFQKEAAAKSALRAYLVAGMLLMAVVAGGNWNRLSLGKEQIPASSVVVLMLVVYYSSYCLSFWDARKAVSRVLLALGVFWLGFVVLSHAGEPAPLLVESLVVPGPFIAGAVLCRWWPRTVGLLLLAVAVGSIFFFHMLRFDEAGPQAVLENAFTLVLIPLPLAVAGVALIADGIKKEDDAAI